MLTGKAKVEKLCQSRGKILGENMKKWIYLITNSINDKVYVGQTNNLERRRKEHFFRYDRDQPLYKAFNKYGRKNFTMTPIEEVENYDEREIYWIEYYNAYGAGGYNASRGGKSDNGQVSRVQEILEKHYEDILYELAWTRTTMKSICSKYGFSKPVIDGINRGEYERNFPSEYEFPIRHHGNSLSKYLIEAIQNKMVEKESFSEIQSEFSVGHQFLADINAGRKFRSEKLKYPLRQTNPISSNIQREIVAKLEQDCPFEDIYKEYNISKPALIKLYKNLK